jgi:hypothetical protein
MLSTNGLPDMNTNVPTIKMFFAMMLLAAFVFTGCKQSQVTPLPGNNAFQTESSATNSISSQIAPASTNLVPNFQTLIIDPSSMSVDGGTATLIIGALHRVDGVYSGNYQIKVFPYFLNNENGTLAIDVSDESLAVINQGNDVSITGTATTSGKGGLSRPIQATATPADINHGNLKLWFMAGTRKMTFEPSYHFAGKNETAVLVKAIAIQP